MDFNNNSEDLTNIFDKRYQVNKGANKMVQDRKKDFNRKFFGIRDKEEVRKEMREANSVESQVNNLKQRMSGLTRNNFNNR